MDNYATLNFLLDKMIEGKGHEITYLNFIWSISIPNRDAISFLKNEAFLKNVKCFVEEDKSLLSSNYRISLEGKLYAVYNVFAGILRYSDDKFLEKIDMQKLEKARKVLNP